ncbi:heme exporter protein CcmB [Salmonella enterica subsp. enterica serovar Cerro]|nr:heme exporter protein CcmB [Salmonella enterica subsp. enterica serovar Cerro]
MLEARDLYCERDERTLFRGLSFTVDAGEWVQVTGGNGAGKTTLLRLLTGLARPDGGEVYWQGEPLRRVRDSFHRSLLWFFLMVITLFPLSVGPQPQLLARIAPGIIQVAALLASLLALERLFRDDLQDGSLEQLMLLPVPLPAVVLAKVLAHWAVTGLPLMMLSPLVALLLGMDVYGWKIMALTLLLGTPALGFLAAPGVALTAGLRRGGVLLGILVLPLSVPVLIFATAAMDAASMHLPVDGYLAVLGALLAGSATLSPFATAAALRISTQ